MGFNLDDYEPVAARLDRWLENRYSGYMASTNDYPRVITQMISEPGADICVMRAELWLGEMLISTGYAEEVRGAGNVNRTSHVENAETSAVGRALANAGMAGSDVNKRPSREEMSKVQRMSQGTDARMPSVQVTQPAGTASDKQIGFAKSLLKKAGHSYPQGLESMDKRDMTALIDALKNGTYEPPLNTGEEPF
jgi:hypothetical protein